MSPKKARKSSSSKKASSKNASGVARTMELVAELEGRIATIAQHP